MPIYQWICEHCAKVVETIRPMSESDVGPDEACECGNHNYKKQISAPSYRWRYVDGGDA